MKTMSKREGKQKDRQYNGQRTNNNIQNITQKLKIEQHESNYYRINSFDPREWAVPAQCVDPIVHCLLYTLHRHIYHTAV